MTSIEIYCKTYEFVSKDIIANCYISKNSGGIFKDVYIVVSSNNIFNVYLSKIDPIGNSIFCSEIKRNVKVSVYHLVRDFI